MLLTHEPDERDTNRPIAKHRWRPDIEITIALIELRILELPATSLRKRALEQMIVRVRD